MRLIALAKEALSRNRLSPADARGEEELRSAPLPLERNELWKVPLQMHGFENDAAPHWFVR
jgi:hypothetical protein